MARYNVIDTKDRQMAHKGLKSPKRFTNLVEKSRVEKFMVEKSGVESWG